MLLKGATCVSGECALAQGARRTNVGFYSAGYISVVGSVKPIPVDRNKGLIVTSRETQVPVPFAGFIRTQQ